MMLLVFSLLTKTRPVSFADAGDGPAMNATTRPKARSGRRGTVLFTCACGDGDRQRTTYRSAGARRPTPGRGDVPRAGGNIADGRTLAPGHHHPCPAAR